MFSRVNFLIRANLDSSVSKSNKESGSLIPKKDHPVPAGQSFLSEKFETALEENPLGRRDLRGCYMDQ